MTSDLAYWEVSRIGPVTVARFCNAEHGYFNERAALELSRLIESWLDPAIRAVVITGKNGRFITHYSVEEIIEFGADRPKMELAGTALSDGFHALLQKIAALPKPVIAAINGDCMGGGLELAMWCDLRVVGTGDLNLGLPEIRLGIILGGSGTQCLKALVGEGRAREMVLLGSLIGPYRALELGLVNVVAEHPLAEALPIATDLACLNPRALANIKMAMGTDEREGLDREALAFLDTMRAPVALTTLQKYSATAQSDRIGFLKSVGSGKIS